MDRAGVEHHAVQRAEFPVAELDLPPRPHKTEHPVVLDEVDDGIVLRTDARDSEVFAREWRDYLRGSPKDLQVIITQDRIYLEKVR